MTINPLIAAKPSFRAAVRHAAVAACLVAASAPAVFADHGEIHPPGLPCGYTVEVIERPECPWPLGPALIWVQGLNADGTVVGFREDCDWQYDIPWIWHPGDTTPTDLPVPPDVVTAQAYDINDHGVVAGAFRRESEPWRGFVYDTNTGEWTELEPVDTSGSGTASANAINNAGVVAGTRSIGESHQPYNAFIWSADDGYTDLGVMEGPSSDGRFIHDDGTVVGQTGQHFNIDLRGFIYNGEEITIVEPATGGDTCAIGEINSKSVAMGFSRKTAAKGPGSDWHYGTLWEDDEYAILLPLPSYINSSTSSINDDEIVVGDSATEPGPQSESRATLWADILAFDLSEMLESPDNIELSRARVINARGQILARGKIDGSGSSLGFLLTPIETPLGDLNGDCEVGPDDLGLLLSEWSHRESPADLTGDGTVGGADLGVLLSNWTK